MSNRPPNTPFTTALALLALCLTLSGVVTAAATDQGFPGRKIYSEVKTISTAELAKHFDNYQIVDARSRFEFDTLHIKGSAHIAVYDPDFIKKVKALRQQSDSKPLVFYCNGRTCYKSYKAADKARAAGIKDVYAYDAGIMDWTRAQPALTELFGKSPVNPDKLLSRADFQRHLLEPGAFADRLAANPRALVIDIRSTEQRGLVGLFTFREKHVPLDRRKVLAAVVRQALDQHAPLYIYDMAGKQVRWLQYYLEAKDLKDYYFMDGGYRGYFRKTSD